MASETRLLVVTDIHNAPKADTCVSKGFPVENRLSLAALSGQPELSGEDLHDHLFQKNGMAQAVATLATYLDDRRPLLGLGYSAGGTALWKAVTQGAPLVGLICVSSTRLRDEAAIPIPTQVFFGDNDPGRPPDAWLTSVPDQASVLQDAAHTFYADIRHPAHPKLRHALTHAVENWQAS